MNYKQHEIDLYLVVGHPVATPGWRALSLGFNASPLPRRRIKVPKIIVVIKGTLLGGRELSYIVHNQPLPLYDINETALTSEQIDTPGIPTAAPSMSTPRQGTIRTRNLPPFTPINQIHKQVVEERRQVPIEVLAPEDQQLIPI